jgi:hypothetical protein
MGIIQNNNSFLNALLLATDNVNNTINNLTEFKDYIVNYIKPREKEFNKLNNGDIA